VVEKTEEKNSTQDLPPLITPSNNNSTAQLSSINPNDLFSITITKETEGLHPVPSTDEISKLSDPSTAPTNNTSTIIWTHQRIEEEAVPITDKEKEILLTLPKRECNLFLSMLRRLG
jgi:hypothetical protein